MNSVSISTINEDRRTMMVLWRGEGVWSMGVARERGGGGEEGGEGRRGEGRREGRGGEERGGRGEEGREEGGRGEEKSALFLLCTLQTTQFGYYYLRPCGKCHYLLFLLQQLFMLSGH